MTKCGVCDYKIEGDVYMVKIFTEYHKHTEKCPDCGKINNTNKNGKKIRVCGACYYDYEQKADELGYIENELVNRIKDLPYLSIVENQLGQPTIKNLAESIIEKPITIRLLGKDKRKHYK